MLPTTYHPYHHPHHHPHHHRHQNFSFIYQTIQAIQI